MRRIKRAKSLTGACRDTTARDARVLIISASMGAGHDGAARNIAKQLRLEGHDAVVEDFLTSAPLHIGAALRSGYEFELRHVPSAYEASYRMWYKVPWLRGLVGFLVTLLTRRRVLRWVSRFEATTVVSTYPLATLCLGRLRRKGILDVPVVNFITDFGVHPLWVHPGVDVNLAMHDECAAEATRLSGRPSVACGPATPERFASSRLPPRADARRLVGLDDSKRTVLVVAGSWGVGSVVETWAEITSDSRFSTVVVCGRDEKLKERITRLVDLKGTGCKVLGWTDDMPTLMAACDVLVENAGGLTSFEALRAGLPVVSYQPIAGHGRHNTQRMHDAGVSTLAGNVTSLHRALAELSFEGLARRTQVTAGRAIFKADPVEAILAADRAPAYRPVKVRKAKRAVRVAMAGLVTAALGWAGLTSGVAMATEEGAGVLQPPPGPLTVDYMGVRLSTPEAADPQIAADLFSLDATAVVDEATAVQAARQLRRIVAEGLSVDDGGASSAGSYGPVNPGTLSEGAPWQEASADARAAAAISHVVGQTVTQSVPDRGLNAWDLTQSDANHLKLVVANRVLRPGPQDATIKLAPRQVYLVDGLDSTPQQLDAYLRQLLAQMRAQAILPAPLSSLA